MTSSGENPDYNNALNTISVSNNIDFCPQLYFQSRGLLSPSLLTGNQIFVIIISDAFTFPSGVSELEKT